MTKAVFLDYTDTIVQQSGKDILEILTRCLQNSDIESMDAMLAYWWKLLKQFEESSYGDHFLTEDQIVDEILKICASKIHLKDNFDELHTLFQRFWMYAPAFDDVHDFFKQCPVPIYIITNNSLPYIETSMKEKNLTPTGIICGDMVKAYKPHKELFEKALEVSGCHANEVIHIGDSIASDVNGAKNVGITPILLDRKGTTVCPDTIRIQNLLEALPFITACTQK